MTDVGCRGLRLRIPDFAPLISRRLQLEPPLPGLAGEVADDVAIDLGAVDVLDSRVDVGVVVDLDDQEFVIDLFEVDAIEAAKSCNSSGLACVCQRRRAEMLPLLRTRLSS